MNTKLFFLAGLVFLIASCQRTGNNEKSYNVGINFRFGEKYFSIVMNESGDAYALKGKGSNYMESFKVISSDTSAEFKFDSGKVFIEKLRVIRKKPIIDTGNYDAPRVEIYYAGELIYDTGNWDSQFWDLFRPLMRQIPSEYNPFIVSNNPFE